MPPSAISNRPRLRAVAPVKAPRSWPNSSDSISSRGIAAQFTFTNGFVASALARWMARAISSLPVPDSPVMSTRVRVGATFAICANSAAIGALLPIISKRSSAAARSPATSRAIARRSSALRSATIRRSRSSGFSMRS